MYDPENINIKEQRGKELETNCIGFISSGKYKKELAKLIEIAEIYKEIVFREEKEKNPKAEVVFDLQDFSIEAMKKKIEETKENNPELYEKAKNNTKDVIIKKLDKSIKNKNEELNLPTEELIRIVEESQIREDGPINPSRPFASDLRTRIAEELELDNHTDLEFYTSTNSHLDWRGVDGFFKFKYKNQEGEADKIIVPFDISSKSELTKEEEKKGGTRLISESLNGNIVILSMENKENYDRDNKEDQYFIKDFTNKIIQEMKYKIDEKIKKTRKEKERIEQENRVTRKKRKRIGKEKVT
jgi:hypothetical protein